MTAYMVYAFYCDECKIKMPLVADEAAGGNAARFVKDEMARHNERQHPQPVVEKHTKVSDGYGTFCSCGKDYGHPGSGVVFS